MARTTHPKPRIACEITSSRVLAARATSTGDAVDLSTSRRITGGAVHASVTQPSISNTDALASDIRSALSAVAGRERDTSLVIPDAAARVTIFDFDSFPQVDDEAKAVVQLRFRRNIPFEADDAVVSFQQLPSRNAQSRVLAVAIPRTTLSEFETVVRDAGFQPGIVVPSTLAALGAVDTSAPTMLVRCTTGVSNGAESYSAIIVIAHADDIILYRAIEGTGAFTGADLVEDIFPSLIFFEDNYKAKLSAVYVDGIALSAADSQKILEHAGVPPKALLTTATGQSISGEPIAGAALAPLMGVLLN